MIITFHSTDRHFPNYATVTFRKIWRKLNLHKSASSVCVYSRTPRNRTLFIRNANYPDQLAPLGKFVEISTKQTCLEITGYRIKYSTVLWLLDLKIRCGRKVQMQILTVNNNSRTSNCQCSPFSKKNLIFRNFRISGWISALINQDKWSSTVCIYIYIYIYIMCVCEYLWVYINICIYIYIYKGRR